MVQGNHRSTRSRLCSTCHRHRSRPFGSSTRGFGLGDTVPSWLRYALSSESGGLLVAALAPLAPEVWDELWVRTGGLPW